MRRRFQCLKGPGLWVTMAFIVTAVAGGVSLPRAIAAESGRMIEKDGKLVFVESTDPAVKLLLDRALKQGLITKEEYEALAPKFPEIDFSKIYRYEEDDRTNAAQELACMAGSCEVEL